MDRLTNLMRAASLALILIFAAAPASASTISKDKAYPAFQFGVTGAWVSIEPGHVVTVQRIEDGSPADGELKPGDILLEANGKPVAGEDPRVPLGNALTQAEAGDGVVPLTIRRDGREGRARVRVPALGAYSATWPVDCDKSQQIIRAHAQWLAESQNEAGWFSDHRGHLHQCMGALFLLSTADPAYAEHVKRFAHALASNMEASPSGSAWHMGYHLIFLSEYYLATGDERVLAAIEAGCKKAADNQVAGGWGHHLHGKGVSVGYVQSGLMNSAGVTLFLGMALARECGITVHEEAFVRALELFYRNVGHGSICYGDHRAELYLDTNGRNAAVACALGVIGQEPYATAGQHLAMMVADSYFVHESGHTGGGFNVLWRGLALPWLAEDQQPRARRHMDQLAWYYDLCRLPGGGMSMLPAPPDTKRYVGSDWGMGVGLTYTAPLKTLRITGKPPTRHSRRPPRLPTQLWGNERDQAFVQPTHARGFGRDTEPPHQTHARLSGPDPDARYCAKMLRHYNPVIRTLAGKKLMAMRTDEAYDQIEAALQDPDPRVRRAACDGVSGYQNWGRGGWPTPPRDVVSRRFVPHIERILRHRRSALWEVDGALWALMTAKPEDIRRNFRAIHAYAQHEEWYLRESAFWSIAGLGKDIRQNEMLALAGYYNDARHVFERSSMSGAVDRLVKRNRAEMDPELIARFVDKVATQMYDAAIAAGYDEMAAGHEAAHRTMMLIDSFEDPPYRLIARDLAKYMDGWSPGNQHSDWLITGNKWQPGLAQIAGEMGRDAGPLIRQFEAALDKDYWKPNDKNQAAVQEAMQQATRAYHALVD